MGDVDAGSCDVSKDAGVEVKCEEESSTSARQQALEEPSPGTSRQEVEDPPGVGGQGGVVCGQGGVVNDPGGVASGQGGVICDQGGVACAVSDCEQGGGNSSTSSNRSGNEKESIAAGVATDTTTTSAAAAANTDKSATDKDVIMEGEHVGDTPDDGEGDTGAIDMSRIPASVNGNDGDDDAQTGGGDSEFETTRNDAKPPEIAASDAITVSATESAAISIINVPDTPDAPGVVESVGADPGSGNSPETATGEEELTCRRVNGTVCVDGEGYARTATGGGDLAGAATAGGDGSGEKVPASGVGDSGSVKGGEDAGSMQSEIAAQTGVGASDGIDKALIMGGGCEEVMGWVKPGCVSDSEKDFPDEVGHGKSTSVSKSNSQQKSVADTAAIVRSPVEDKLTNDASDISETRDFSETISSPISFNAMTTSASEGSVTLDSPSTESVSSIEDSPPKSSTVPPAPSTITETPIITQTGGAPIMGTNELSCSNDNDPVISGNGTQMVELIVEKPVVSGDDGSRPHGGAEGIGLPLMASPSCVSGEDVDSKLTQEVGCTTSTSEQSPDKNLQQKQDAKPDMEADLAPTTLLQAGESGSVAGSIVTGGSKRQLVSDGPHQEELICVSISSEPAKVVVEEGVTSLPVASVVYSAETDELAPAESVRTSIVSKEVVSDGDNTQDVGSAGKRHASRASITSPDSSIGSSGPPPPPSASDRAIDPYSVALDNALGSSSFNMSFVSTDVSTDPDHTDAESVNTNGESLISSPTDSDAVVVSSPKDLESSASDDLSKEDGPEMTPKEQQENVEGKVEIGNDCKTVQTYLADQSLNNNTEQESLDDDHNTQIKANCSKSYLEMTANIPAVLGTGSVPAHGQAGNDGEIACSTKEKVDVVVDNVTEVSGQVLSDQNDTAPGHGTVRPAEEQKDQSTVDVSKSGGDTVTTDVSTASKPTDNMADTCHAMPEPKTAIIASSPMDSLAQTADKPGEKQTQTENKHSTSGFTADIALLQTEKSRKLSMSGSISSLTSIPEVVFPEALPMDECDGSKLTISSDSSDHQGDGAVTMAPPSSSVVMRKKPGVRIPPQPAVKDVQLQQKIDHEIKMRDGTTKLLAASKHPSQLLEAAKNLLTSNARMIAYMSELQRRKTDEVLNRHRKDESSKLPCKAKVAVSDIRIPLMWRDSDHFKNKGDHRRFAVFCVLKIGTQIYDMSLVTDVDSSMTDLTFDDVVVFDNMAPDFECTLEVYSHRLCDDHSIASTPRRLKKKFNEISTSVSRSVGRRLSGLKDDPDFMANMIVGPRFELIASATLTLVDASDSIGIFDLPANSAASTEGGSIELPLFGNFCCRLAAQPQCMLLEVAAGSVQMKAGSEAWRRQWCMLGKQSLCTWASERDQKEALEPIYDITITSDACVKVIEKEGEAGHALQLSAWSNGRRRTYTMATESRDDRDVWATSLQQHIIDIGAWKQACDKVMDIELSTPPNRRSAFGHRPRSSLYDETPWNDDDSPMTRVLNRLELEERRDSLKPL